MSKKQILSILGIFIFVLATLFLWDALKGISPTFFPTTKNIEELLESPESPLMMQDGFTISVFAENLFDARVLSRAPSGEIFVSAPNEGKIFAISDANNDGYAETKRVVLDNLIKPHGMAWKCKNDDCNFFVGAEDGVYVFDFDEKYNSLTHKRKILDLPRGGHHNRRSLIFLPYPHDERLLVSVGSSCNACEEKDSRQGTIIAISTDDEDDASYAQGLRNAPFLAIHPVSGKIWVTEMGRDLLGDDLPPDEINILEEGQNYGWPYCYGKNIHDAIFDTLGTKKVFCDESTTIPSYIDIPAHSAPLGLAFIPEEGWPEKYAYDLLVAYHGSWNRTIPTGYKIVRFDLDQNGMVLGQHDFISGWLSENKVSAFGRPVDILIEPGGVMYISDDKAGVVYRVTFTQETH